MNENQLIEGCKKANPIAQRALLDRYADYLYGVALRYSIDRSEAKDVLQEGWINIFKGMLGYRNEGKLKGWMARIIINIALRKKEGKERKYSMYVDTFFDEPSEDSNALDQLQYDDLIRLVNQLPDTSREVFKMAAIDGLKHREIGEILNIEPSTSRAHLTRARKRLRELVLEFEKIRIYEG